MRTSRTALAVALVATLSTAGSGCMALSPQLGPTDYGSLEALDHRGAREQAYAENTIYRHELPQGTRYTKGTDATATPRSWQSLDAVLRSDANSAALLPRRSQRLARIFTALTIAAGIVTIAGAAASAREGLDLGSLNGTGGLLLGGGLATLGFGVTAGVFYGKTKRGYENAVDVYNDSLGMRLGVLTPHGEYIPPRGTLVDEKGFVVLEENERALTGPAPAPAEGAQPETSETPAAKPALPPPVAVPPSRAPQQPEGGDAPDDAQAPVDVVPEAPAESVPEPPPTKLSLRTR